MAFTNKESQISLFRLTLQERREAFEVARRKLIPEDRLRIDTMVNDLVKAVKARHPNIGFSPDGALEVIAGLGMFLKRRS